MRTIVGRSGERAAIEAFLADTQPQPRALLVEGEPGIGKTTLLRDLVAAARDRGYPVLACRPTRSEMDLSYVNLVEILDDLDEQTVRDLPAPQARLLRMVLRREEPEGPFDSLSLNVAVVAALRAVAARGPMVLVIDDFQWIDNSTARTFGYVARRLTDTAARIVLATRSEPSERIRDLPRAMPQGRFETIRLGPVQPSELSRILRLMLGWAPAWPSLLRIAELSGGNPLYAVELARASGGERSGEGLGDAPPGGLVELARSRVAGLPERVREVLELAAVPRAPTLELLRRLDSGALDVSGALAGAERAGLVAVERGRVRFTHPILAAAVYGSIPALRRQALHRAVAMLCDDLEERARHLAAAAEDPDPAVALVLASAAERASVRGAPVAAADLMRLSCELTPAADAEVLTLRRIAYGRLLHSAGDNPGAVAAVEAVLAELPPGPLRARALFHLMYIRRLTGSLEAALAYGMRAVDEAADDPSFQAEVYEMVSRLSDNDIARKLATARAGLAAVDRIEDPDPYLVFHTRAALVEAEFYAGLGIHLERLAGLDPGERPRFPPVRTAQRGEDLIGRLLTFSGRIDEGLDVLRAMCERAAVSYRGSLPSFLAWAAEAQIMAGRFEAALGSLNEAIERSEEAGSRGGYPWEVGVRAVALAMLGRLDEAEASARTVVGSSVAAPSAVSAGAGEGASPVDMDHGPALIALGLVAIARGHYDQAVAALRLVDHSKREAGLRDPRLWMHVSDLVEALLAAGALEQASEVVDRLDQEATTSQGQWSLAMAARCRALLLAARGELDEAVACASHAVESFDGLLMPFERARTLFVLGQLHRRRKEKKLARAALSSALATFDEVGAAVWAQRARAELTRIPLRQAAPGLTATEEAVARLAAQGLSNREIAERAFMSPKTVEVNLTRIYRKLGVRSRTALAGHLGAGGGGQT
jgi:DNA-binding CsgD family transcriptional regulator